MKRLLSILFVLAGGVFFLLGLLFVVGAKGVASRMAIGVIGLGAGAVLVGFGIRWFRAADADSPEQVLADLLEAARRRNGELSQLEIGAALGRRAALAGPILDRLVADRLCERKPAGAGVSFVFKDLQPKLFVRKCSYCGAEASIVSELPKCTRCGAPVATSHERKDVGEDGAYRMDE